MNNSITTEVHGYCHDQFAHLHQAFIDNFKLHNDVGAAISLVVDGELLVNLHGGYQDKLKTQPWTKDTLVNVWSTTKGVSAACFAMLVDRGVISYETRLSEYWSAFNTDEKKHITVAMLLSHQAGLCGFRKPATVNDFYNRHQAAEYFAQMQPFWTPGDGSGYHPISVGIIASEFMMKVYGKSMQEFVREDLAEAYGLDISIGLDARNYHRAAQMIAPEHLAPADIVDGMDAIQRAALDNPALHPELPNSEPWRRADIPSANGFATAESLALLYDSLARGGTLCGKRFVGAATIAQATEVQNAGGLDRVMKMPAPWACGFLRNAMNVYGPNPNAFGHSGWGGSFAFADPDAGIGFAYTMNRMGTDLVGDPRAVALVNSLYQDLSRAC